MGVLGISHRQETPRKTQDTPEGLRLSAGMRTPRCPAGWAGGVDWGQGSLDVPTEIVAPATRLRIKR